MDRRRLALACQLALCCLSLAVAQRSKPLAHDSNSTVAGNKFLQRSAVNDKSDEDR
jgi:hypothetical protein